MFFCSRSGKYNKGFAENFLGVNRPIFQKSEHVAPLLLEQTISMSKAGES